MPGSYLPLFAAFVPTQPTLTLSGGGGRGMEGSPRTVAAASRLDGALTMADKRHTQKRKRMHKTLPPLFHLIGRFEWHVPSTTRSVVPSYLRSAPFLAWPLFERQGLLNEGGGGRQQQGNPRSFLLVHSLINLPLYIPYNWIKPFTVSPSGILTKPFLFLAIFCF